MPDVLDKKYNVEEVAELTKKSHWAVRYWIKHKLLTAYKVGNSWIIYDKDLQKFISNGTN